MKTEELVFHRLPSDSNGNPRYVVDYTSLCKLDELGFHGMIQRSEPTALIAQMMLSQLGEHERELLHFQGFDDEKINAAIEDMRRSNETMALLDALPD